MDVWLAASTLGGSVILTHRMASLGPHWPHPALALGCPFLRCHPKGRSGETRSRSSVWHFVIPAFSSSFQHPDRHKPGLCLGGTLSGLADFCCKGRPCPLWRRFTNIGSFPPAFAWLFSCVDYPDAPHFGTMHFCTYSGMETSPLLF